jgi:uncharacterized protein YbjT (DUF2867 family)
MILVTGATGHVGSAVIASLLERKEEVRAMVHTGSGATVAGTQTVEGSFEDAASLKAALDGIDTMFLVSPGVLEWESAAIAAAADARLTRVVKESVLGADDSAQSAILKTHAAIEGVLFDSGVPFTILRPNDYMQNFTTDLLPQIKAQSAISLPAGDAKLSFVDVRDIAEVAAVALLSPELESETIELTGPESISYFDAARIISEAAGRRIAFNNLPDEIARQVFIAGGLKAPYADALIALYAFYRSGGGDVVNTNVYDITGREPRTLQAFAQENAAVFAAAGPPAPTA